VLRHAGRVQAATDEFCDGGPTLTASRLGDRHATWSRPLTWEGRQVQINRAFRDSWQRPSVRSHWRGLF
jgi:hypothetical protein